MIPKRWSISQDNGTTWREVSPLNGSKLKLRDEQDLSKGLIAFRRKLTGSIMLGNDAGDYGVLYGWERAGFMRCNPILVKVEQKCQTIWRELWRGKFSAGSCKWDLDNCIVEIKPKTVDRFTCLEEKWSENQNLMAVQQVLASASFSLDIEFGWTLSFNTTPGAGGWVYSSKTGIVNVSNGGINGWGLAAGAVSIGTLTQTFDYDGVNNTPISALTGTGLIATYIGLPNGLAENIMLQFIGYSGGPPGIGSTTYEATVYRFIWWRQHETVPCEFGASSPPVGTGWTLLTDNCGVDNTAEYVRPPQFGYVGGSDVYVGPGSAPCGSPFYAGDNGFTDQDTYFCYDLATGTAIELNRSRLLQTAVEYLITQTGCDIAGVRSDLFEWNPVGDAPGYSSGINYVTGGTNQLTDLLILQKTDAKSPDASQGATIGEISMVDMIKALRVMFQVFCDIDDEGYFRIEHWKFWASQQGIDVTTFANAIEALKYEHLTDDVPRIERARWMEAAGRDFIGKDIVYSGPCVSTDKDVEEHAPGRITTDLEYVFTDPGAIANDGFVILAASPPDGDGVRVTIIDIGAITGELQTNAPLSWANLQRDFWTWNRYLPEGNLNGTAMVFDGFLPTIQQENVQLPLCCKLYGFNASNYLTTALGQRIGVAQAMVETVEHDLMVDQSRFTLRYSY